MKPDAKSSQAREVSPSGRFRGAKLFVILQSLSPWELKSFEKFVASPFFNPNEKVSQLFFIVEKEYPEFEEQNVTFEKLFVRLFKKEKFNHQKIRYVLTGLTLLLEKFLAYKTFEEKIFYQKKFLLHKLKEKNLDKYFQQHLTHGYDIQKISVHHDLKHYKRQLGYDELSYEFTTAKSNRAIDTSLQSLSDNLDVYYLSNKLKYCCEILNRQNIVQIEYQIPFLEYIISYLGKNNFLAVPVVHVYFLILKTLREPDLEKQFTALKKYLQSHHSKFTDKELSDVYAFVLNYCIRKVNTGKTNYVIELFEIYKFMLERELLLENKKLSHSNFKNIVAIALRLTEFKWTENFIQHYQKYLDKELQKNSVNYNLARLYFAKQEYRTALKLLTSVEFTDVYYHLDAKSLLLKTYYETDEMDAFFSLVSTFKIYLRRTKLISEYQRIIYFNLVKHTDKLFKLKTGSKVSLKKIKDEIKNKPQIADIGWLTEKIEEFEL